MVIVKQTPSPQKQRHIKCDAFASVHVVVLTGLGAFLMETMPTKLSTPTAVHPLNTAFDYKYCHSVLSFKNSIQFLPFHVLERGWP